MIKWLKRFCGVREETSTSQYTSLLKKYKGDTKHPLVRKFLKENSADTEFMENASVLHHTYILRKKIEEKLY